MGKPVVKLRHAVGDTLRTLRMERGLTLRQASGKNHVALGYLCEIERGQKEPSLSTLDSIANGMEMSTADLILEIYKYLEENE